MGTSKVYGSPKWPGVNHAVGSATSPDNLTNEKMKIAVGAFAGAYKNYLTSGTSTAGTGPGSGGTGHGSSSGGARGGGSGGVTRGRSARSGSRLANFLTLAQRSGLDAALREYNLSDLRNKPLDEFLQSVTDTLSGDGGLLDDSSLNRAMAETINALVGTVDSVDEVDTLLSSGSINVEEVLQVYYANILAANFEQKEYSVVREKISREDTKHFFAQAREIIKSIVRDELPSERNLATIDWNSSDGQLIADGINRDVLGILMP